MLHKEFPSSPCSSRSKNTECHMDWFESGSSPLKWSAAMPSADVGMADAVVADAGVSRAPGSKHGEVGDAHRGAGVAENAVGPLVFLGSKALEFDLATGQHVGKPGWYYESTMDLPFVRRRISLETHVRFLRLSSQQGRVPVYTRHPHHPPHRPSFHHLFCAEVSCRRRGRCLCEIHARAKALMSV